MPHPKDNELLPKGTEVIITHGKNLGKKAVIKDYNFQFQGKGFLNYYGEIEGRSGMYVLYHDEIKKV